MKKITPTLISLFLIATFGSELRANTSRLSDIQVDNKDYHLNISEADIPPMKDTIFGGNKCLITNCPLTLTNNTDDTLKYAGMAASWWDIYAIDNKNFSLAADYWNVFKNGPTIYVLPPHQSATRNIKIIASKDYFRGEKLRIIMRLQKVVKLPIVGEISPKNSDSNFTIRSNEVTIR
jgi:hypothetical protein